MGTVSAAIDFVMARIGNLRLRRLGRAYGLLQLALNFRNIFFQRLQFVLQGLNNVILRFKFRLQFAVFSQKLGNLAFEYLNPIPVL